MTRSGQSDGMGGTGYFKSGADSQHDEFTNRKSAVEFSKSSLLLF
jgi:hypothetical protein